MERNHHLNDAGSRVARTIRIRASFMAVGFGPAQSLVGAASPGELAAGVLDLLAELAPDELTSAAYDRLKD